MEGIDRFNEAFERGSAKDRARAEKREQNETLESKKFRVASELQMELMLRLCTPEEGDTCFDEWPDKNNNGEKFRKLFEATMAKNEEKLNEWDLDPQEILNMFLREFTQTSEDRYKIIKKPEGTQDRFAA